MSNRSSLWYFEDVDLYGILCPHKVPGMKENHTFNLFQKAEFIYFPNEPSTHIYLITNGRVKIGSYTEDGKEILKAILGRGEIFGEMAIAGEERRADFAQALDANTSVCPMTVAGLQELMKENQALSLRIFKLMGLRLRRVERKLESLVFKDARSRVVDFIREMAEERGQKVGYEMLIKTKFTHKDIASLTGTSRQTVTTILNELKTLNVINFDRRRILVRDMAKLK